jgi:GMP synthase-like glutamine amidotransferase
MRILSIVQQADAGPGVFAEAIAARGDAMDQWLVSDAAEPPSEPLDYDAVIVLGGSMNVDEETEHPWLTAQKSLLREFLGEGVPLLGVCLGAQLLAEVAGGEARRAARSEIGWHPIELTPAGREDPLLAALPGSFTGFQWHSYEFTPPPGAEPLARSEVCLQAARLGPAAWVIQFHAEVSETDALSWIADYRADPDAVRMGVDPDALGAETSAKIGAWNELGRSLCTRFLELAAARG